jgi:hypothetical protein
MIIIRTLITQLTALLHILNINPFSYSGLEDSETSNYYILTTLIYTL